MSRRILLQSVLGACVLLCVPAAARSQDLLRPSAQAPERLSAGSDLSTAGGANAGVVYENLTPAGLLATAGPLVRTRSWFSPYDRRYAEAEELTYGAWLAGGRHASPRGASDYGALRSRFQWSLRNGLPAGRGAPATGAYARGVEMTRSILQGYLKRNDYMVAPHNATNLADVEMLYVLEGDPDALECIKGIGRYLGAQYLEQDLDLSGPNSDPRSAAIVLQALSANARYGLPYTARSSWGSNWKQAAATLVGRMSQHVQRDGKVVSQAHKNSGQGDEAFFMNAMLAAELMRWHGFVEPQRAWLDLSRRILDHLIEEDARRGGACLPYTSNDGNSCAHDLAGFYVWPALVMWQETGLPAYKTFALKHIAAAAHAFVSGAKQFNQAYSTGAQSAEALLSGVRWSKAD